MYSEVNIKDLLKIIKGSNTDCYPYNQFKQVKKDLCVHTQGKLFEKIITIFENEAPETTKFVLESYEPITTASIKKGIDSLSRIFKNSGVNIIADEKTYQFINEKNYTKQIIEEYIEHSVAEDPNTVLVPYFDIEKNEWEIESVESDEIINIDDDFIIFIDDYNSDYIYEKKRIVCKLNPLQLRKSTQELLYTYEKVYTRKSYIYISKNQYISFVAIDSNFEIDIKNFDKEIDPYTYLTPKKNEHIHESPVQSFVPYGNKTLIQHRGATCVENLYHYPRMSEVEMPCDECNETGKTPCGDATDLDCLETCHVCKGKGTVSMQSEFKIYTRKLIDNEYRDYDPVKFHTPDVNILNYNKDAWQNTLMQGEKAIYVQQNSETGNVQSASSREKQMEEKYAWLDKIGNCFYSGANKILNTICILNNLGSVTIEKPMSYAIMSEIESFEYLNLLVSSETPALIKSTHIENFLKKYVSNNNPIIKAVNILKKVDKFIFTTEKYLETLSNNGIVTQKDWIIHAYSYPILSQMYANDSSLFLQDIEIVTNKLLKELEIYYPKELINAN